MSLGWRVFGWAVETVAPWAMLLLLACAVGLLLWLVWAMILEVKSR